MSDSLPELSTDTPSPSDACLRVPLGKLASHWPRSIQEELATQYSLESILAVPLDELDDALRHGKVRFPWNRLRGWIVPPLASNTSPRSELCLELPLTVVAPLFTAQVRE